MPWDGGLASAWLDARRIVAGTARRECGVCACRDGQGDVVERRCSSGGCGVLFGSASDSRAEQVGVEGEPGRRVGVVCAWCRHLQARLASHAETLLPTLHILTACSPQTTALLTSTHRRGSISSYNSNAYSSKLTANTTARLQVNTTSPPPHPRSTPLPP